MHVGSVGNSEFTIGVSANEHACLSIFGPVLDWIPVKDVSQSFARRLQQTPTTLNWKQWVWIMFQWMDGLTRYQPKGSAAI